MAEPITVFIPLLNPNEPEALLAAIHIREGQPVSPGDPLFSVETTKSAEDVSSEVQGFITGVQFRLGQTVRAGEIFCTITESPSPKTSPSPDSPVRASGSDDLPAIPPGLRITQPALALVRASGLDLGRLPVGPLITESLVHAFLLETPAHPATDEEIQASQSPPNPRAVYGRSTLPDFILPDLPFDSKAILVYGGGGHGKIMIDLLRVLGIYHLVGVLDDGRSPGDLILGIPVLGGAEQLPHLLAQGVRLAVNGIGGIGNVSVRIRIYHRLAEAGFGFPVIIHPTATIEPSATIAPGVQVLAKAYLGSSAQAGFGVIISTGAIVSHDCILGGYVNISPGAILAGDVQVGDGALIGMGVTVNLGVKIGAGARIGNSATVTGDVPEGGIVRAGTSWPR